MITRNYTGRNFQRRLLDAILGGGGDGGGLRPLHGDDILGFAPIGIAARDHDVEYPLMPLFFGLNQSERLHVDKLAFDPVDLILRHAAALQVDRQPGQM